MCDEFRKVIAEAGLTPPDCLKSGKIHRFPGQGKRNGNTAGWCILFEDMQGGMYGDWSTGLQETWMAGRASDEYDREAFIEKCREARRKAKQEEERQHAEVARIAQERWQNAQPEVGEHRYLREKGISAHDIRTDGFNLVIPLYDSSKRLCSIQTIDPNGVKRFLKGGRKKGCYYPIGKPNGILCLAEGFATAATIHEATGHAVATCFDSENLKAVADILCCKYSHAEFIICADDDYQTEGNPGVTKAFEAATVTDKSRVVKPDFCGSRPDGATDFNDMAKYQGLGAVKRVIEAPPEIGNLFDWIEDFTVSTAEAEQYDNPEWLYENLIISGHVVAIPAPPNGGKTTVMMHVAGELASDGLSVFYVNADVGRSDAKSMVADADRKGFKLLLPDMKSGRSMQEVVTNLEEMNVRSSDLSSYVFIFDTLKKMTDVINKSRAKELYRLLRGLSAKGMTIVLLAHTNKYNDDEGKPIYEGTGDLRSDVDELIYFIPEKHDDGSMTISTEPDKTRGKFEPVTFRIDPDRNVEQMTEYVDVASKIQHEKRLDEDSPVIEAISEAIEAGKFRQTEIIEFCRDMKIASQRRIYKVLKAYSRGENQKWIEERGFQHNLKTYRFVE